VLGTCGSGNPTVDGAEVLAVAAGAKQRELRVPIVDKTLDERGDARTVIGGGTLNGGGGPGKDDPRGGVVGLGAGGCRNNLYSSNGVAGLATVISFPCVTTSPNPGSNLGHAEDLGGSGAGLGVHGLHSA
jgi:hypothetical protein